MNSERKSKSPAEVVPDYILSVARAALNLSKESSFPLPKPPQASNTVFFLEAIARSLLKACEPDILLSDIDDLPVLGSKQDETQDSTFDDEDDDDNDDETSETYNHRRTDYLRKLLRFMAPISMQIASQICHDLFTEMKTGAEEVVDSRLQASLLLFSHWLRVAPHLTPMVTDLFQSMNDPWKTVNMDNQANAFLFTEAAYRLGSFFVERRQIETIHRLWDWTFLFDVLDHSDTDMTDAQYEHSIQHFFSSALQWYAARALTCLFDWKPLVALSVLERWEVSSERVPWEPHPWTIEREEKDMQMTCIRGVASLWNSEEQAIPSAEDAGKLLPSSPYLVNMGNGICFYKRASLKAHLDKDESEDIVISGEKSLVPTLTTLENLSLLATALSEEPHPPPIMLCGPQGSGKSSILREMLRLCRPNDSLLEFHIDEETDSKTLIGSYSTTDVPGEFEWRPGALTHASRQGRWVLFEDLDCVPIEIQAAIVKLLEDRLLPIGNGKYEKSHPDFRIFGTVTTAISKNAQQSSHRFSARTGAGRRVLNPSLWRKVHVEPLPFAELREVALALFTDIPPSIVDTALSMMKALDTSGRKAIEATDEKDLIESDGNATKNIDQRMVLQYTGGRSPSVRDFFKLLSRIANGVPFEKSIVYATEAQRTICLAEAVEILVGSCANLDLRQEFVTRIAAPAWGVSGELARAYINSRCPTTQMAADFIEIGRAKIHYGGGLNSFKMQSKMFAQTNYSLRLMESIAVCVRENEPALLVGETGCGKTTVVQQLARLCERELVIQNLSLQTDSTDLLGGFKPLELKHVARKIYLEFVDLFCSTFSRKQNSKFLEFGLSTLEKGSWKKLSQCFQRAAKLGTAKMKERAQNHEIGSNGPSRKDRMMMANWNRFEESAAKFERQIISCDAGLAFVFSEGALVEAIKHGKWVLLDEINLASSDTLQRLCGLLDDPLGSVTLTERGDASEIPRHPSFRLFAAMNPATDAGKKDLPTSIRSRFSELYVHELLDPVELRIVAARYLESILPVDGKPAEHKDIVIAVVEVYLKCRQMADTVLADGAGHKPRYTLRTLSRALTAAKTMVLNQRIPLTRALYEGFQLAFEGALDAQSVRVIKKTLKTLLPAEVRKNDLEHPGRKPSGKDGEDYVLVKPFWIKIGPKDMVDRSEVAKNGKSQFILTPTISASLRKLCRALASGPWPILLEGPTSAGKTTLVEYVAARCGHHVVRINNHEHTDVQEYTGMFASDQDGGLSFRDGLLVQALRRGHWVILDELNLAPSEVLEALNRLLDDNRELYLAETNETVKPHPDFRLFATQNPSGAYGGRKPLSRAFRNRFVEIHMGDIPSDEMTTILEKRCGCPPSTAKKLVDVMVALRYQRSKNNIFMGKDSFITPRDLLRWAERKTSSRLEFAEQGYMLLAERLRSDAEKDMVKSVLEECLKVKLNLDELYFGENSVGRRVLHEVFVDPELGKDPLVASIAPTKSLLRLLTLVSTCIEQKEPVLLVGDTGCGKTTVVQFLSLLHRQKLYSVNCHATTETSDLLGGLRPVRGRDELQKRIFQKLQSALHVWPHRALLNTLDIPQSLLPQNDEEIRKSNGENHSPSGTLPDVEKMMLIAKSIKDTDRGSGPNNKDVTTFNRDHKRRKLNSSQLSSEGENSDSEDETHAYAILNEAEGLAKQYNSLFEWTDGPLVIAMKSGQMLLLDEMSLAEDAVLERLNSVLEPSRTLVLAEKGDDGSANESSVVVAHEHFKIFATMNPGGDFGKRELSPALRSRFTEIWVPAVNDREDFELVLSRFFPPTIDLPSSKLVQRMLDYVEWFNTKVCGDPTSPCVNYDLSLRDVLSWANFVVEACETNRSLGVWEAFVHGTALMHLDGLGLGAGLAVEDAETVRRRCESHIYEQLVPGNILPKQMQHVFSVLDNGTFGAKPFYVPLGPMEIPTSTFNLAASTTAANAFRVLRAMQIKKPVLLEGSPGVGKTSLINALAAASGNTLVRINLSEQTDIADLMGSDLPVQDFSGNGASFEWSDGVLLRAIKAGSWVLLDELNLASQSVLEGLNSCLDHRATVYIPELGKTFHCPPTFRVFGAQNPLAQGGGRKGLPKSFLNRFTKVYVDSLTDDDLTTIIRSRYPSLDNLVMDRMINFNKAVHSEVVERREYGSEGSPWEFNLRDVFRWCDLLNGDGSTLESCARDIFLQRFRNGNDRDRVNESFRRNFDGSMQSTASYHFQISNSSVRIGETCLPRTERLRGRNKNLIGQGPLMFLDRLSSMEALSRCVAMQWPCLLIGPSGSGKTSMVTSLAEVCNTVLLEQCLSPSSDVTELLGCFEQTQGNEFEMETAKFICEFTEDFFCEKAFKGERNREIWIGSKYFQAYIEGTAGRADNASFLEKALNFCILLQGQIHVSAKDRLDDLISSIRECLSRNHTAHEGHFVWRDGVLVEAMLKGYWLVLNNVNLCPSSVLDRLNSVMEIGGELLLSECGTVDADGLLTHRVIKPHPNFRVFLTMNPLNGEISRAMRNRCMEIYLETPLGAPFQNPGNESLTMCAHSDFVGLLHGCGTRTSNLATSLVRMHIDEQKNALESGDESYCPRVVASTTKMMSSLLSRGHFAEHTLKRCFEIGYELKAPDAMLRATECAAFWEEADSLVPCGGSVRNLWSRDPCFASVQWDARAFKLFEGTGNNDSDLLQSFLKKMDMSTEMRGKHNLSWLEGLSGAGSPCGLDLATQKQFFLKPSPQDLKVRFDFFKGFDGGLTPYFKWMSKFVEKDLRHYGEFCQCGQSSRESTAGESSDEAKLDFYLGRKTLSLLRERMDVAYNQSVWCQKISRRHLSPEHVSSMTVLEASYAASKAIIDRSMLSCPITPIIFSFFEAADIYAASLFTHSLMLNSDKDQSLCQGLAEFFKERDRLWDLLKITPFSNGPSSFLGFDETKFLVQWKWFSRSIPSLTLECFDKVSDNVNASYRRVSDLVTIIDDSIFGRSAWYSRASLSICKKMMRPKVPRQASQWETFIDITNLASSCVVALGDPLQDEGNPGIDLACLVDSAHPFLYLQQDFRKQLLAVTATIHSFWTNEVDVKERDSLKETLGSNANARLRDMADSRRREFDLQLKSARVDTNITTVENQLSAESLNELRSSSSASSANFESYSKLSRQLLSTFAQIQMAPLIEHRIVVEEINIVGEICRAAIGTNSMSKLLELRPLLQRFIKYCFSSVAWAITTIRPYQTLLWVIENGQAEHGDIRLTLRSLIPPMLASLSLHTYTNAFNRLGWVTTRLDLPNMWADDENRSSPSPAKNYKPGVVCFGNIRTQQKVVSEILLKSVGEQFALNKQKKGTGFFTAENHEERLQQYYAMHRLLASSPSALPQASFWTNLYLSIDVLSAIRDGLGCDELDCILSILKDPTSLQASQLDDLGELCGNIADSLLKEFFGDLILPLLRCLKMAWLASPSSCEYRENIALAMVYLGLLRARMVAPQSPLDPGKAPNAKVYLIDHRLKALRTELHARQLYSSLRTGISLSKSCGIESILQEGEAIYSKRSSQASKIVSRPPSVAPFHELFQLSRDFLERVLSIPKVLEIIQLLLEGSDEAKQTRRVDNFLQTLSSFLKRIEDEFVGYDEVTTMLHQAVRMIQEGVHTLQEAATSRRKESTMQEFLFHNLIQYPMPLHDEMIACPVRLISLKDNIQGENGEETDFRFAMVSVALSRLVLKHRVEGLGKEDMRNYRSIIRGLSGIVDDTDGSDESGKNIEDINEQKYREQFPDHRREFNVLFESADYDQESDDDEKREMESSDDGKITHFSGAQLEWICSSIDCLFSGKSFSMNDSIRMMAFHYGYNGALALEKRFSCTQSISFSEPMGGHSFSMMLSTPSMSSHSHVFSYLRKDAKLVDFQNEPNPGEAVHARGPLERLMARTTQLLTAFPCHSILLGIGRVCDKVCKFDIMTTPIGKVMTGMEVILRQAQDWEQHASDRVRLGNPLQEVAKLVATWRKLELDSWPQLISARRTRYERKARRHLIRLQSILVGVGDSENDAKEVANSSTQTNITQQSTPRWLWKGAPKGVEIFISQSDETQSQEILEITKILDTFILTSPIGEFKERLKILLECAVEQETEHACDPERNSLSMNQARALRSIHNFYNQFQPSLTSKLDGMIAPIQTKLKDEAKLARWDEQTYYALAESTERNHRKLMNVLAELDECLDANVGLLVQEEKVLGIRASVDSNEDVSTAIPPNSSIFPTMKETNSPAIEPVKQKITENIHHVWTAKELLPQGYGDFILNIPRFSKKMMTSLRNGKSEQSSLAGCGTSEAAELSTAIFDRIASLRSKSTRPMKERALADLFRELKRHGFTTTKWSVPDQLRDMNALFQLPNPDLFTGEVANPTFENFRRAEAYYYRCLNEMNEYRSEAKLLGSKHLTKREMDMMLTLGESGLWLISQQRGLVSNLLSESKRFNTLVSALDLKERRLPSEQSAISERHKAIETSFSLCREGLQELSLLVKSSQVILDDNISKECARDVASKLEQAAAALEASTGVASARSSIITTYAEVERITCMVKAVDGAFHAVNDCKQSVAKLECLPLDPFVAVLSRFEELRALASSPVTSKDYGTVHTSDQNQFVQSISLAIERSLISFQELTKAYPEKNTELDSIELWNCHRELLRLWSAVNLIRLNESLTNVLQQLKALHEDEAVASGSTREVAIGLTLDVGNLAKHVDFQVSKSLATTTQFFANSTKLVYVILRVFRVLLSKGFCSDETAEDEGSESGDVEGMTFQDDQDGTGMGEGDGKRDVTEQLDSEEQLSGLRNEQEDGKKETNENRQLNEEEAQQGMEMEADFDGEMCDLPDKPNEENPQDEEDDGEELDREMGDDASPDEQVVDEKMWNDSDDEDDIKKDEEKFEKDSGVEGETIDGATRTKDDDEGENGGEKPDRHEEEDKPSPSEPEESSPQDAVQDDEGDVNDDNEDRYEDRHGVDVKGDEKNPEDDQMADDPMDLGDDLNLDEGGDDGASDHEGEGQENEEINDQEDNEENPAEHADFVDPEQGIEEYDEADDADQAATPSGAAEPMEVDDNGEQDPEEPKEEDATSNVQGQQSGEEQAHGVQAKDGTEGILDEAAEINENGNQDEADGGADSSGAQGGDRAQSESQGGSGYSNRNGTADEGVSRQEDSKDEFPNPFKNPGDVSKFWHKKLNMVEPDQNEQAEIDKSQGDETQQKDDNDPNGDFQYTAQEDSNTLQMLGEVTEEDAVELEKTDQDETKNDDTQSPREKKQHSPDEPSEPFANQKRSTQHSRPSQQDGDDNEGDDDADSQGDSIKDEQMEDVQESVASESDGPEFDNGQGGNKIVSDLSRLKVEGEDASLDIEGNMTYDEQVTGISSAEAAEARCHWLQIQGETYSLSRRLCEKLRLVLEPLVASKLRGDYRTGKRINMKRVIGYIASGYRKDKIWLRRTKPAKRDYRILLAVDDSESMKKSGAGEMALRALATLAVGMNQLEIGELGVASFGEDMKLLHPFHLPFSSDSGADMVMNFKFDQKRTRTSLCVESAIAALDEMGGSSSMQLVFLVSDGRIERDSRDKLKRLIREMMEKNILLAMIIVEGEQKQKDSIVNMKEVSFEKGKPVVKRFIEDYPFPYYIILDDMSALPEVLGDALRQWFEMLSHLQSPR